MAILNDHKVIQEQSKPNTVIKNGVTLPDLTIPPNYAVATTHAVSQQTGQILNRIGDI